MTVGLKSFRFLITSQNLVATGAKTKAWLCGLSDPSYWILSHGYTSMWIETDTTWLYCFKKWLQSKVAKSSGDFIPNCLARRYTVFFWVSVATISSLSPIMWYKTLWFIIYIIMENLKLTLYFVCYLILKKIELFNLCLFLYYSRRLQINRLIIVKSYNQICLNSIKYNWTERKLDFWFWVTGSSNPELCKYFWNEEHVLVLISKALV